jgi:beta-phosphoglucomutase
MMNRPMSEVSGRLDALIFDVDGVLFQTEPLHRQAWRSILPEFGIEVTESSLLRWTGIPCQTAAAHYAGLLTGKEAPAAGERLVPNGSRKYFGGEDLWRRIFELKEQRLMSIAEERLEPADGLRDSLAYFAGTMKLAYATSNNREMIDHFFSITGIGLFFTAGITYEDVVRTKPSPEPYQKACRKIGVPPGRALALEDSPAGIRSARKAGLNVLGIAHTLSSDKLAEASRIFPTVQAACEWIKAEKVLTE